MKKARLTAGQKKTQKALEAEIKAAKKLAEQESCGVSHKYVKKATQKLIDLYATPRFCNNQKFLLARYAKLEGNQVTWTTFFVPLVIGLSPLFYQGIYDEYISTASKIQEISTMTSTMDSFLYALYIGCWIGLILLPIVTIYSVIYIGKGIYYSLIRQAESTVNDNEMCIIKPLLTKHKILLEADITVSDMDSSH